MSVFLFFFNQFSLHICLMSERSSRAGSKLARSAVKEVFVYVIYLIIVHAFPTRLVFPSLLPDLLLAHAGTIAQFLLVGVILEKGDVGVVWQEDWPRGVRTAVLRFSAPVSKKHSVAV